MKSGRSQAAWLGVAVLLCLSVLSRAQNPVICIDATTPYGTIAHAAVGANHLWMDAGDGIVSTSDLSFKPGFVEAMSQMDLGSLRWPCGTRANLFRWKRAIGPIAGRTKIPLGQDDSGYDSKICYFGPDECGRLRENTGMDITVLINCATGDANEAADLVEYLNAPQGTNPRGGTAWADVRAANGHPAPYGFKYFEIGNEYNLAGQNYWLDPLSGNRTAYAQAYTLGGSATWTTNGVVTDADFSPSAALADGTASQVKYARYPPVDPSKPYTLYVNGQAWTCVTNLSAWPATSTVYTLDFPTGTIRFGDGFHGATPGDGLKITLSYTCGRHDGFVDYCREMKAVDPTIKIYSPLDWSEFCNVMSTNHPYDGIVKHLYPSYGNPISVATSEAAWFHRVTSPQYYFTQNVLDHYGLFANATGGQARNMTVVMTEFGAPDLAITTPDPGEQISGHPLRDGFWYALLMQATSAYGMPLCQKHMLLSNDGASDEYKQLLFHAGSSFVLGAAGHAAGQVARLKDKQLLACWTANNPIAASHATFGQRQALQVTAARDTAGALWLLVFNLSRYTNYTTTIRPLGLVNSGTASVWTVNGAYDWSNNWDTHVNDVSTSFQTLSVATGSFAYTFPKHSITVMQVSKALFNGAWQPIRDYAFTNASTAPNAWYPAYLEWWLAGKTAAVMMTSTDPAAGYALRLVGEDPSHGRATLTFPASYTNGLLRLSADVWSVAALANPLYISLGDDDRNPNAGVALSYNHDGLISYLDANGNWQATQAPYYQDAWLRLDLVLDLDARKYDVLLNGFKLFVGGEGRDAVATFVNPVNKVTFETSGTTGDNGTFYIDNVTVSRFVTNASPTVPTRPALTNCSIGKDGQCLFWVTGDTGLDYSLYASTNLLNWELLLTTNLPAIPFALSVPTATFTQRFFRLRLGP
jgi:alpha-L-arabinofuranosidase